MGGNITSSNSGIVVDGSVTGKSNEGYGVYVGSNITSTGAGISVGGLNGKSFGI